MLNILNNSEHTTYDSDSDYLYYLSILTYAR